MTRKLQRRLGALAAAAATAFAAWHFMPGTAIDRAAFTIAVRAHSDAPFFISGHGTHAAPWNVRSFASRSPVAPSQAPVVVSLGDDLEGVFQSTPPSPIDLAVVFNNFQRLGAKDAATAALLAWDAPDPVGLMALDTALSRFDSLVMAAPLSRGATPEPMPPAFRKASIPLADIQGDAASLPAVNRIPLPGIILGAGNTLAGFQTLESEPATSLVPLIARWEDRIVFAFPLLTVLQRLKLPVDGVEIVLGQSLKLGPDGPVLEIDRYGRMKPPPKPAPPFAEFSAASLIGGDAELLPKHAPKPVILRDDRSAAEPATRAFSKNLPAIISAIASSATLTPATAYPRLSIRAEISFLLILVSLLATISCLSAFERNIAFLITAALCLAAQCIAFATAALWLPGAPALAAILAAVLWNRKTSTSPPAPAAPLSVAAAPPGTSQPHE